MGFVWHSEQREIVSLNSINQVIVVMDTGCILFVVENGCLFNLLKEKFVSIKFTATKFPRQYPLDLLVNVSWSLEVDKVERCT
jgi:hypothetical protein